MDQGQPGSMNKNNKLQPLHKEIGDRAKTAHITLRGWIASRGENSDLTHCMDKIIEYISTLVVGEVVVKTTTEAAIHPSPTARINAAITNAAGRVTWSEITGLDKESRTEGQAAKNANSMLRKAAMCMVYKLEGTSSPRWRATVQLMNWVAHGIPIIATPLLMDIFPTLEKANKARKPYSMLFNNATGHQWENLAACEQDMPKILRCTKEDWESGNLCKEKRRLLKDHRLASKIRQLNTLFLLWAATRTCHDDTVAAGMGNKEPGSRRAAKEALRNAGMEGVERFLNTSEAEYNVTRLDKAIRNAQAKGKVRLAQLVNFAHEATVKGKGRGITAVFGGDGTECPDCKDMGIDKLITLDPADPAKNLNEHLPHCGTTRGMKNKNRESPLAENQRDKRARYDQQGPHPPGPSTPTRGANQRGGFTRGYHRARGGFPGNSPRGFQGTNPRPFTNMDHVRAGPGVSEDTRQVQWGQMPAQSRQGAQGHNMQEPGYYTGEYQGNNHGNRNQWGYRGNHNEPN